MNYDKRIIRNSGTLIFCQNRTFDWFIVSLYNEIKKVGVDYERKEKSFVCGQWGTEHFAT